MTVGKGLLRTPKVLPKGEKSVLHICRARRNSRKNFHAQLSGPPCPTASTWEERRRGPGRVFLCPPDPLATVPQLQQEPPLLGLNQQAPHCPAEGTVGYQAWGVPAPLLLLTGAHSPQAAPSTQLLLLLLVTSCPVTCRSCQRLWEESFNETPLNFPAFENRLLPVGPGLTEKGKREKPATPPTLFPPAAGRARAGGEFTGWASKV